MLKKIFFLVSMGFLLGCEGMPLLLVDGLDTKNGKANPFQISRYDLDKCQIEVQELPSINILGPELHGAFCLRKEEFAKFKAYLQTECKNRHEVEQLKKENADLKKELAELKGLP